MMGATVLNLEDHRLQSWTLEGKSLRVLFGNVTYCVKTCSLCLHLADTLETCLFS